MLKVQTFSLHIDMKLQWPSLGFKKIAFLSFNSHYSNIHADLGWSLQLADSAILVSLKPRKMPWTANEMTKAGAPKALNARYLAAGPRMGDICSPTSQCTSVCAVLPLQEKLTSSDTG
jgi:hypothetical protein